MSAAGGLLTGLVLSRRCAGCTAPDAGLCPRCARQLAHPASHRPDPCPRGLPRTSVAGEYAGPVRAAILAYKEHGRAELSGALGIALAAAVRHAAGPGPVLLVPVPSTRAAVRRRGGDHMRALTRRACVELRSHGQRAGMLPALRLTRVPRDSAALTATERARNLRAIFDVVGPVARLGAGWQLVVVDDLVTTGATLAEAAAAFRRHGQPVLGAAIAGTARRVPARVSGRRGKD